MKYNQLIVLIVITLLFILPNFVFTQIHETLPSWHWAYRYIDELRLRGCFEDLYTLNRPYSRTDVAEALIKAGARLERGELSFRSQDLKLLEKLVREFRKEIMRIRGEWPEEDGVRMGIRLQADLDKPDETEVKYRGIYRSKLCVPLGQYVTIYNGINFDQYLVDDPNYVGKKWRGVVGYTEQAYATVSVGRFRLKFGRDFLHWGAGESGTLLFSDVARPMDQFKASATLGPFRYTFFTSVLDDMELVSSSADSIECTTAKRYVSAHRLDAKFFQGRLQCAITEAIIYGGTSRHIDWVYLNPFIFYHGAQLNESGLGNTMGTVDVIFYPVKHWKIYGSLLIDDIQVEKTGPGDLEPSEIGWIVGSKYANPLGITGLTLSGEYACVTNRTYKTLNTWEKFIHRNVTLGHPVGNDFDLWQVGISKWFMGSLQFNLGYSQTRKGEGSIFTPWDAPWSEYTVEEGYSEPFPTGVVEQRKHLNFSFCFYPSIHWGLEGAIHYHQRENGDHIEGVTKEETFWRFGLWFDGDVILKL